MRYQLVLQVPVRTMEDYEGMVRLEERLRAGLGNLGVVDGHDAGSGEGNIFIHTGDPWAAFARARSIPGMCDCMAEMKAAYRDLAEDSYTVIHPPDLTCFHIT